MLRSASSRRANVYATKRSHRRAAERKESAPPAAVTQRGRKLESIRTDDGVELAVWSLGDESAPAVILTHGGSMDHSMWDPQIDALRDHFRVITHDVRAHGSSVCPASLFSPRSAASDISKIMDTMGIARAVLIGHSLGGVISQLFALERPDAVLGFVGIGCGCVTMAPSPAVRLLASAAGPIARLLGPARMRQDSARKAGITPRTREYARQATDAMADDMFERQASVSFGDYGAVAGYHIGVPLLLLQERDRYRALISTAAKWAERDGGRYVVVPGAGHNAGQDVPEFVNTCLVDFLAGAVPGR